MLDPIKQEFDVPDRETAIKRLHTLQQDIVRLRDDIPGMQNTTRTIRQYLEGLSDDVLNAIDLIDQLMASQETWLDWLTGRLTLLANLKLYLMQVNNLDDLDLEKDGA